MPLLSPFFIDLACLLAALCVGAASAFRRWLLNAGGLVLPIRLIDSLNYGLDALLASSSVASRGCRVTDTFPVEWELVAGVV